MKDRKKKTKEGKREEDEVRSKEEGGMRIR